MIKVVFPDDFSAANEKYVLDELKKVAHPFNVDFERIEDKFEQIRAWAKERGIYLKGDPKTQTLKLGEEFGELCKAVLTKDEPEIVDAIGDCVVVLTNLAELCGLKIEDCITSAYNVISSRKGKMQNGTFVKETVG